MKPIVVWLSGALLFAGCAGVPPKTIRAWADPNFKQYRSLVEKAYSDADTRANAYKSMAALICDADTVEQKQADSKACKCQNSTSDADVRTNCQSFIEAYPSPSTN